MCSPEPRRLLDARHIHGRLGLRRFQTSLTCPHRHRRAERKILLFEAPRCPLLANLYCRYRYLNGTPLWSFGFGLSYGHISYEHAWVSPRQVQVSQQKCGPGSVDCGQVTVCAEVTNCTPLGLVLCENDAVNHRSYVADSQPKVPALGQRRLCKFTLSLVMTSRGNLCQSHYLWVSQGPNCWRLATKRLCVFL